MARVPAPERLVDGDTHLRRCTVDDAATIASAAIPQRLGYRLEALLEGSPETPGETGRTMVWVMTREHALP